MEKIKYFTKAKSNGGITLIALIVTIIILIIIAGISIASLTSDNGILRQTNAAKVEQIEGTAREQVKLAISSMRLAIAEASAQDNSYDASENAGLIQAKLKEILNEDKEGLNGTFDFGGNDLADDASSTVITIGYTGDDYKNACNNPDAKIIYTIALEQKTIEMYKEQNSILKGNNGGNVNIDIGGYIEPGIYQTGSNDQVLEKTWDELVKEGVIHVNGGVLTTNYDSSTKTNSSSDTIVGELVIPKSVTNIGKYAFRGCTGLTNIVIPENVTSIGEYAFRECTNLANITIPESVTSIGKHSFAYCTNLANITIPQSVISIGDGTFAYTNLTNITIPESVTSIGKQAFYACTSLVNITIPESVTSIGDGTFYKCESLANITIPESVTSIGEQAFRYCTSLANITIPESVTSIRGAAFADCTNLTNIIIPESVTSIGEHAFEDCVSLVNITLPESVTSIGNSAFINCTNLTNVTIPESVTSIGDWAFDDCASLTNIKISKNVTSIGIAAFMGCTGVTSIEVDEGNTIYHSAGNCIIDTANKKIIAGCANSTIPTDGSAIIIGESAFENYSNMTSIRIPKTITKIERSAFDQCKGLETFYYEGTETEWNAIEKVVEGGSGDWDYQVGLETEKGTYTVVYNATE